MCLVLEIRLKYKSLVHNIIKTSYIASLLWNPIKKIHFVYTESVFQASERTKIAL